MVSTNGNINFEQLSINPLKSNTTLLENLKAHNHPNWPFSNINLKELEPLNPSHSSDIICFVF